MAIAVTRASVRRALRSPAAVVAVLAALAQPAVAAYTSPQVRAVEALEATSLRPIRLAVVGGMPRSVSLDLPVAGATPTARARAFLSAYAPLFHLDRPGVAVTPARVLRPVEGVAVVRHSQTWGGIPVYGAHLDVFLASDAAGGARVAYAGASLLNPVIVDADPPILLAMDTTPRLKGTDAELIAYAVAGCAAADGPEPRLEIVDPAVLGLEGAPRLAWHVARPRCAGNEALVDALTGEVLFRNSFVREDGYWKDQMDLDLEDANGGTINSTGCFNPTTMDDWIGDVDGILPDYLGDADAVVAWHGARDTYRTWHDLWGWHSFDGDNSELEVYVHAGVEHNAHGLANCGIEIGDGFAGIDVVAHEFGHMVIQVHSGYYMWNQAGALHEGLSDAAAMVVDSARLDDVRGRHGRVRPGTGPRPPGAVHLRLVRPVPGPDEQVHLHQPRQRRDPFQRRHHRQGVLPAGRRRVLQRLDRRAHGPESDGVHREPRHARHLGHGPVRRRAQHRPRLRQPAARHPLRARRERRLRHPKRLPGRGDRVRRP